MLDNGNTVTTIQDLGSPFLTCFQQHKVKPAIVLLVSHAASIVMHKKRFTFSTSVLAVPRPFRILISSYLRASHRQPPWSSNPSMH